MLYPYMTLEDQTEIVHSESYNIDGTEHVRVEIEKPVQGGFESAQCLLPEYKWSEITGFTDVEIQKYQEIIESSAHIIIRLARNI